MLIIWRNRGILVPIIFILSIIISLLIDSFVLKRFNVVLSTQIIIGIGVILSSVITYLLRDDYYKDKNGKKEKIEVEHSFFFISMASWSYVEIIFGLGMTIYEIVQIINKT
jgi:hypothetical protein